MAVAAVLTLVWSNSGLADLPTYDRVRIFDPPRSIHDPVLVDKNGARFQFEDLRGRIVLVLFGFTNCPDVCPLTMAKFAQLRNSDQVDNGKMAFVLVSVDSERDSPETLKAYVDQFSSDFMGVTGNPDEIRAVVKSFSASYYKSQVSEIDGSYTVAHSPQTFVLDTDGRLRAEFYDPPVKTMAAFTKALIGSSGNE